MRIYSEERKPDTRHIARSLICKALVFVLCASSALSYPMSAEAANSAKAKSMRLEQTEGDVGVTNITKGDLTYTAGMRLGSGDDVDTDTASYAWISLDDSKAIKVDEVSEVEVRQKGKNLEALLVSGNLYFNVTVPLKSDESMNIRTSTMATGIRGTCGWVSIVDGCNTRVHLLEGVLHCKVINPVDGQIKTVTIHAGEWADFTVYGVEVFDKNPELISTSDGGQVPVTTPIGTDTDTASGEKADTSAATAEPAGNAPGTDNNEDGGSADEAGGDTGTVSAEESEIAGTSADTSSSEDGAAGTGEALQESEAGGSTGDSTYNERPEIPVSPDGESCDISMSRFTEDDIPGFVLVELVGDDPLIEKIYDQSGIDLRNLTQEEAEEKLAEKEAETAERMQAIREAEAAQESNISKDPVWERGDKSAKEPEAPAEKAEEKTAPAERVLPIDTPATKTNPTPKATAPADTSTPSSPSKTDATPTQSAQAAASTASTPSTGSPAPTGSTNNDPATQPGSSNTNTPNNNPNSTVELTMPQTATTVQDYLNQSGVNKVVLNPGSGNNTLDVDIDFTVPAGKNLTASAGVPVDVNSGKSAAVNGTANLGSSLANNGSLSVNSSHTLTVAGAFTNSGTFNNTSSGRSEFSGGVTNTGTFTTSGTLDLNSAMTTTGSFTISGGTVSAGSGINATAGSVNLNGGTLTSTGTTLTIAGAALTMDGGTLTSSGTALQVSSGSFTMNSGTVTSATTGQTVVLNTVANVHLNAGEIKNMGDGGAISVPANTDFHNIMTSSDDMHITAKTDNLLGTDVGKLDETTGTSYGFISVWGGTEFNGELFDPNTMHPLTLSAVISATEYDLETISTPAFVKAGVNVPLTVRPKTGYQIDSVAFVNPDNSNSDWGISYTAGSSTGFTMPSGPVEIRVTASKINYQLTKPASVTGGTIGLSVDNNTAPTTAQYGQTVNVNATPATGYRLKTLTYTPAGGTAAAITHTNGAGSFTMPAVDVTVNAEFEAQKYNVTLNLNAPANTARINSGEITEYTYGVGATLPQNVVRETDDQYSYTFDGWFTSSNPSSTDVAVASLGNNETEDKIFYAKWTATPRTYTVTLNTEGGTIASGHDVTSYTYGTGSALPDAAYVTKAANPQYSYAFAGWYTSAVGGAAVSDISSSDTGDMVLYAHWNVTPRTYNITYHHNDGTNAITADTYTYGASKTLPGMPDRQDYYFAGWYTTANPSASDTSVTTIGASETGDKEFYAKWTDVLYTVTKQDPASGGTFTVSKPQAAKNETITITPSPSIGYELDKVQYKADGSLTWTDVTGLSFAMPDKNVTVRVEFKPVTYAVSLNPNAGTDNGSVTITGNVTSYVYGTETILPTNVTRTGTQYVSYIFDGWFTLAAGGDKVEKILAADLGVKNLFAHWTPVYKSTDITADTTLTGGGAIGIDPANSKAGDTVTINITCPTGKVVDEIIVRKLDVNGNPGDQVAVNTVTPNVEYTFVMPDSPVSINVLFTNATYSITYETNGGVINGASYATEYTYGTGATLPTDVTRAFSATETYEFDGWYTALTGGTRITAVSGTETGAKTFYAHWISKYISNFNTGVPAGTASVSPVNAKAGDTVTITIDNLPVGKVVNQVIVRKVINGTPGDQVNVTTVTPNSEYTFTMPDCPVDINITFRNATYSITYEKDGGVINDLSYATEYTYETGATLPTNVTKAPTATESYDFDGWYTDATGGTKVLSISGTETGAKTYYAHWTTRYVSNFAGSVPNGTATVSPVNTKAGDTVTVTIDNLPTGKIVDQVIVKKVINGVEGDSITVTTVTPNVTYTFTMPDCPVSVNITFRNATYAINYVTDGGVINDSPYAAEYTYETGATLPTNVTRASTADEAYDFDGWYTDATGGTKVLSISGTETGDKTYYAHWITKYRSNIASSVTSGVASVSPENSKAGDTVIVNIGTLPAGKVVDEVIVRKVENGMLGDAIPVTTVTANVEYTFTMPACPVSVNVTLKNATYTITYEKNGGTINDSPYATSYTYETGAALPADVTKNNYAFGGWFTTSALTGNAVTSIAGTETGDKTFYAKWLPLHSIIKPVLVNGSIDTRIGSTSISEAAAGTEVTIIATPNIGYELDTLSVKYTSGNTDYPVSVTTTNGTRHFTMPDHDVTVTASFRSTSGSSQSRTSSVGISFIDADSGLALSNSAGFSARADIGSNQGVTMATTGDVVTLGELTIPATFDLVRVDCFKMSYMEGKTVIEPSSTVTLSAPYSFTMGLADANYKIYVREKGAAVTSLTLTGGSVTITPAVSRTEKVKAGETVTLTFTPDTGLALNTVTLTGANGSSYIVSDTADTNVKTFVMPDPVTAITVNATFKSAVANANIPVSMPISANALTDYLNMSGVSKVTLTPKAGDSAVTSNTVNITGTVTIPDGVSVDVEQGVYLNVSGTLNIGAGSTVTNNGVMTNQGTINVGAYATLINNGTLATSGDINTDTGAGVVNNGKIVQTSSASVGTTTGTAAITSDCGTCGDSTYYYLDADPTDSSKKRLTVLGIGNTQAYTSVTSHQQIWYTAGKTAIKSIVFEEGITRVGDYMFIGDTYNNYYTSLTTVVLSDTVKTIGANAFDRCGLNAIDLNKVETIETYAFSSSALTSVTLPDTLDTVGACAFFHCESLTQVTIPDLDIYIGERAFQEAGLTSLTVPATPRFGGQVFMNNMSLTDVVMENGRTTAAEGMFTWCRKLENVTLPNTLESIADSMFSECNYKEKTIAIPASVKKIGTGAFSNCNLTSITLPENLEYIQGKNYSSGAFAQNDRLTTVTIPSKVKSIGRKAFYGDWNLTTIRIEDSDGTLQSIDAEAFDADSQIETVYYGGTEALWNEIRISDRNSYLTEAKRYYYRYSNPVSLQYPAAGGTVKCYIGDDEISASQTVMGGEEITVVATPASGYETGEVTVTKENRDAVELVSNKFTMPTQAVTVSVEFISWNDAAEFTGSTAAELQTTINENPSVKLTSNLTIDSDLTIGANKVLVVDSGVNLTVASGSTLTVSAGATINNLGTVTNNGEMIISGTVNNRSTNTVVNNGKLYIEKEAYFNNGSGDDNGRFVNASSGRVGNLGTFENNAGSSVIDSGLFAGNDITGDGSIDNSGKHGQNVCSGQIGASEDLNVFFVLDSAGLFTVFGNGPMADFSSYYDSSRKYSSNSESITSLRIEEGISRIGSFSFVDVENLAWSDLHIASTVEEIGEGSFYRCLGFNRIELPETVKTIEANAFENCSNVTAIVISENVESIGNNAFYGCGGLTSVSLPESDCTYGTGVFSWCDAITEVHIPLSMTFVPEYMFSGCSAIRNVYYPGNQGQWNTLKSRSGSNNSCLFDATIHCANSGYCVTIDDSIENGTVTAVSEGGDIRNLEEGNTVTFTLTPDDGYECVGFNVWATELDRSVDYVPTGSDNVFTFEMPASNVEIEAWFMPIGSVLQGNWTDAQLIASLSNENIDEIYISGDHAIEADITIPAGVYVEIEYGVSVTIMPSYTMTVAEGATLTNYGTLTVAPGAELINNGDLGNFCKNTLDIWGTLTNNGSLSNGGRNGNGRIVIENSGILTNNGMIYNEYNSEIRNYGTVDGNGTCDGYGDFIDYTSGSGKGDFGKGDIGDLSSNPMSSEFDIPTNDSGSDKGGDDPIESVTSESGEPLNDKESADPQSNDITDSQSNDTDPGDPQSISDPDDSPSGDDPGAPEGEE
ncbi:MAG: leucine-rich repeat protein [Lachnospiraceae bacterium]|nr:leucine-rich repeat protein [Lachnospiraceae bacterium]